MLKLHQIFLRKFLAIFLLIFLISGVFTFIWMKNTFITLAKEELLNNTKIISLNIDKSENIDFLAVKVKSLINSRVTIIDATGNVIGESDRDKETMDNHINRAEIIQAKYQDYGHIIRHSKTLDKDLLYVAKKFDIGHKTYYIRVAKDIEKLNKEFLYLVAQMSMIFGVFLAIAFFVAIKISKNVAKQTDMILEFLTKLTKQNKASTINSDFSKEYHQITKLLTKVSKSLAKKDKQKSKYTAKLKASNQQKDNIISAISHEFKNPISVITGYSQTLLEDQDINEKIREKFLTKIASNSGRLTNMIDRLRLSMKLDEGKQNKNIINCNIKKIAIECANDLKDRYPSRQISVIGEELVIEADETLITIAILNLIENGLKYSEDEVVVNVTTNSIEVQDKGIGISEKNLSKITNKFFRVSKNGWDNSLGLGLSIVNNIINIHKFKLDIKSVENEGSTFIIRFS